MVLDDVDLSELSDDGDVIDLEGGRKLRLRVEADDMPSMPLQDHGDCWGKTSQYVYDYRNGRSEPRPEGFNGNAEKIQVGRGEWAWWQPPDDVKRGTPEFRKLRDSVRDLCEFGFRSVGLELLEGEDAYYRPIVRDAEWLGGIEPFPDDAYRREVMGDLWAELKTRLA